MSNIIASGVQKVLSFSRQTAKGTIGTGGQNLRRVSSNLDLSKQTYTSNEIKTSQQSSDMRHGVRSVEGTLNAELSVGTYQKFFESICRQNVLSAVTSGALTDVAAASTTANMGTFTRGTGSWITSGFRIGMVVRATGFAAPATANNAANFMIIALTATVMTVARLDGSAIVAKAAGDSVTFAEAGKHTYVPQTGHTRDYYTIEHWFSDIAQSEVFTDCVVSQSDVKLPASGLATVDWNIMGIDMQTQQTQYFNSATAANAGRALAAVNGVMFVAGAPVALITGLNFSIKGGFTKIGGVVGSNVEPDIFPGKVTVDGQATVLFIDATFRDYFKNETEVTLCCAFTTANTANADFMAFTFPRVKVGGSTKDDGEKGLVLTMPFVALENDIATNTNLFPTTVVIQDSTFS
jgi:hypothetical protein